MINADRRHRTSRRLAALGALSSAGLALAGNEAEAGIVVTTVNADIGFATGDVQSVALNHLPGVTSSIVIQRDAPTYTGAKFHVIGILGYSANHFRLGDYRTLGFNFARTVSKGATIGAIPLKHSAGLVTAANTSTYKQGILSTFSDKYFLFSFQDGSKTLYGWILGSLTDSTYDNMTYHLTAYAYDDSGQTIAAGDTGAVPEPGTAMLGLLGGALVGGAAGVRRWKKAKADAARASETTTATA